MSINVTNTLAAVSESGTSALIDKNDVGTLVIQAEGSASASQQAVPEPGTLAIIGGGLIALILRSRRPWRA